MKKRSKKVEGGIIEEALERFDRSETYDAEERNMSLEDVKFVHDEDSQWTEQAKSAREGRPCMTFDKVSGAIDQVMGDHLQNRPAIKIRAAKDGTTELAETYTGLIRSIESSSNSKRAYSNAFKFAVSGGFGCWRVDHDYQADDSFEQDLLIKPIANPFAVYFDPMAELPTKEDGQFWFLIKDMLMKEFEDLYPKAKSGLSDYEAAGIAKHWFTSDMVRVAEYWRRVPDKKKLYRMSDGSILDESADPILDELEAAGISVEMEREVDSTKIEHFLITGSEILEEYEHPGKFCEIVPIFGKSINIEGKFKYRGLVRKSKDGQRAYNYERSNYIEQTALQPKQPYLATGAMLKGNEQQWQNMNTRNDPVLIYNLDQGQGPQRQAPGQPNSAYLAAIQLSSDDIKSQTGIYDASMGARSNETSGKAILERDRQGDTATFEYTAELVEALEYTGRILVDMIPKIYDSQRMITILGEDEAEEVLTINKTVVDEQTAQPVILNDLSKGQYDVVVKTGASYSTKRTETATQLSQVMAQNPEMGQMFADIYFKSLDLVGGEEVIERIRKLGIQKGFIEPNDEEKKKMEQNKNPQEEEMKKQAGQLKMRGAKAAVEKQEAEVMSEQAQAKKDGSMALLNSVKAQVEQLALASAQGDMQNQQMIMQRLQATLSPPPQMPQGMM